MRFSRISSVAFLGFIVSEDNIQMDPAKVSAVAEWPTPSNHKHLQRFLVFAHSYRHFIRNYSTVAAPLHNLTSSKMNFQWSLPAEQAFLKLKETFTSAPVLTFPDPSLQSVVEVDASDVGVGGVLSQHSRVDNKHHPSTFLSLLRKGIMMWGIGSCWLLKWPWRSGATGWRERSTCYWFGRTTRT